MRQDRASALFNAHQNQGQWQSGTVSPLGMPDGAVAQSAPILSPTSAQEFLVQFKPSASAG